MAEAAKVAHVSERTLRHAIATGKVKAVRMSKRKTLVRPDAVEAWAQTRSDKAT